MTDRHDFEQRLAASWLPETWAGVSVLLAVSGGADSVALLRAIVAVKQGGAGTIHAAHFNHRLRGLASDEDERFVVALCQSLGVSCTVGVGPEALESTGDGLEAAARQARYAFLQATAEHVG